MGYHENDNTYPDVDTPSGKLYGSLTNTPIRHHRLPDTNTMTHADNFNVYNLNIECDLTPFLALLSQEIKDKVISWDIVIAERTEENKTVLDKGFTTSNECLRGSNSKYTYGETTDPRVIKFYSPKILFNKSSLNHTHYKVEYFKSYNDMSSGAFSNIRKLHGGDWVREYYDFIAPFNSDILNHKRLTNFSVQYPTYISDTTLVKEQQSHVQATMPLVTNKEALRNYNYTPHTYAFFTPMGYAIHNPEQRPTNGTEFNIPAFWTYGALKNEHDVYIDLSNINYIEYKQKTILNSNIKRVVEGDTFISPMCLNISSFVNYVDNYDETRPSSGTLKDVVHDVYYVWVESEINVSMRHQKNVNNLQDGDLYYQGWISYDGTTLNNQWLRGNPLQPGFEEHLEDMSGIENSPITNENMDKRLFKQAFLYNNDYNYFRSLKNYSALSYIYNFYNDKKDGLYKYRYSEKSFQDTIKDNYKTFKSNNYITQDAQLGDPIDLFVDKNELYSRTNKTVLFLPTNTQTIKTNDASFYLGNASVLPYDPKAVTTLNYSYGGGYDFTHKLHTEYGTILIDIFSKKVFMLRDGLQELSGSMNMFFKNFLYFDLLENNIDTKKDKIIIFYDTSKKRFLITVKRHVLNKEIKDKIALRHSLSYDKNTDKYILTDFWGLQTYAPYDLEQIATLEEFTISYSFLTNKWISFHSYVPDFAFETNQGFVQATGGIFWKHEDFHNNEWLRFNGQLNEMVVEFVINEPNELNKLLSSLNIKSEHINWDYLDVYTNKQHTGHQPILAIGPSSNSTLNQMYGTTITGYEGYFRIDRIIDRVNDSNVNIFSKNNKLEKILNESNIATSNKMVNGSIRSNAIKVRLTFTGKDINKRQSLWAILSTVDLMQR